MKRISMVIALALALLVSTYSQTPQSEAGSFATTQDQTKAQEQTKRGALLTPAMREEYTGLVKSDAGEAAVRAWARKHKLEIVSLKGYDILVIPEQGPQNPTVQEAANCDAKKCPTADGTSSVFNTLNQHVGFQVIKCKATSCKWVKDINGRWQRFCGGWKCENDGGIHPL